MSRIGNHHTWRFDFDLQRLERRSLLTAAASAVDDMHLPGICCCAGCMPSPDVGYSLADAMRDGVAAGTANRGMAQRPLSDLRLLSSNPGAPVTLFLDFDGAPAFTWQGSANPANGNNPYQVPAVPAFSLDGNTNDFTDAELDAISDIWVHVAEKFAPFNVNVTTVDPGNRNDAQTACIIIGGSWMDWYGESFGGVALLEGFTLSTRSNTGFVWSANAITAGSTTISDNNRHFIAESAAHEAGHLFALRHQSSISGNTVVDIYSDGDANRAPIMGGSSNNAGKRGLWWNGPSSGGDPAAPTGNQDDIAVLTRPGNIIATRADDFGNGLVGTSGSLFIDGNGVAGASGLIETVTDADAFVFNPVGTTISLTVSTPARGGMLAPTLELIKISGSTPAYTLTTTNTSATITSTGMIPGDGYQLIVRSQGGYGNIGSYVISGSTGAFATLDPVTGIINVSGYGNSNNNILLAYNSNSNRIVLENNIFGGSAIQSFVPSVVTGVRFNLGAGNDRVGLLERLGNVPVTVNGGGGDDTLVLEGSSNADTQTLIDSSTAQNNATPIRFFSMEGIQLSGFDGADYFDIRAANIPVTVNGDSGADRIDVGSTPFAGDYVSAPVTVNGGTGFDTLNVGANNADSVLSPITFNGGTDSGRINYNDTAPTYRVNYTVRPTQITRDGLFTPVLLNYSNTSQLFIYCGSSEDNVLIGNGVNLLIEAHGNDGNDTFQRGEGNLSGAPGANFFGGNGNDTIIFDDSLNTVNNIVDLRPNELIYGGLILQDTTGFETVSVKTGSGNDQINFVGSLQQAFIIDSGAGNDTITIGYNGKTQFFRPVSVNAGSGNDSFIWQNGSNNWYTLLFGVTSYAVTLDGGSDFNTLTVNDSTRGNTSYDFSADRVYAAEPEVFPVGHDFTYDNMNAITLTASNGNNAIAVRGTSPDIATTNQVTLLMSGGNDQITLYPRDPLGNLTINGNLGIGGGAGADSFAIDDMQSTLPIAYRFYNQFGSGTTNISGLGTAGFGVGSDVESTTINAGIGDDTFNIERYLAAVPLTLNGGDGNDTFQLMPVSKNLAANMATTNNSVLFNGGAGEDSLSIANDNNAGGHYYQINGTALTISNLIGSATFSAFMQHIAIESTNIRGGPISDSFLVRATNPGAALFLNGGPGSGNDSFAIGYPITPMLVAGIQSGVFVDGGDGGTNDSVTVYNGSDTVGRTLHIGPQYVGAEPGDDLFGAGGYLYYAGITGTLTVKLGSGADTVYAVPNPITALAVEGNGQPAGISEGGISGDFIGVALADVVNPTFTPGATGAGIYTSDNRRALTFTGIEDRSEDAAAPEVISGGFTFDDIGTYLDFAFSEDVSAYFSPLWLEIVNTDTFETLSIAELTSVYDPSTHSARISFDGYPLAAVPDGRYAARVLPGLPDLFGNVAATGYEVEFHFIRGDLNNDGQLNNLDIAPFVLALTNPASFAASYGYSPKLLGDVNQDGSLNNLDIAPFVAKLTGGRPGSVPTPARLSAAPTTRPSSLFSNRSLPFEPIPADDNISGLVGMTAIAADQPPA